jgi:uncharacterized repeat protein (TIGR03803 family)
MYSSYRSVQALGGAAYGEVGALSAYGRRNCALCRLRRIAAADWRAGCERAGKRDCASAPSEIVLPGPASLFTRGPSRVVDSTRRPPEREGDLYGTTFGKVIGKHECGTVFSLSLAGAEKTLHRFQGPDGCLPRGRLIRRKRYAIRHDRRRGLKRRRNGFQRHDERHRDRAV